MGLLCAACLAPGRAPPAHVAGRARDPGPSDALAAQLAADGGTRHWSLAYAGLPRTARSALAGFLHEIALRRAIEARDLEAIRAQMAAAGEAGHADGPQWRQAAELLERVALLSDECGGQAEARPPLRAPRSPWARRRGLTSV
jgi:hypothetical protein